MGSVNLDMVKQAWRQLERDGHAAGMEALFEHCDPDCEFRPYAGRGETFHGVEAAREFFARERETGADIKVSSYSFVERDDRIEVLGWIRLIRPDGGLADSQGRWTYVFRDGKVVEADYVPGATSG